MKSEPRVFSFADLMAKPDRVDHWEGVRNYQARNFMARDMKKGDPVLFYHSSCPEPAVAGLAEVFREAYPDYTSWDPASPYYDPRSLPDKPRWFMVDLVGREAFACPVTLGRIRLTPGLSNMVLLKKGRRLSIQPVEREEFEEILLMGRGKG